MSSKRKGELMMILASIGWSISGVMIKFIPWNPILISGARGIISSLVMYSSMRLSGHKMVFTKKSIASGIVILITVITFITANKLTTAANAIVLQYIAPVFVLLMTAFVLKRKLRKYEIIAVAVSFLGIVFFFMDQLSTRGMIGNILAIISGFFMSITYGLSGEIKDDAERISGMTQGHFMLAIICTPIGLMMADSSDLSLTPIILIIIMGIFQMGIPYVLFGRATALISGVEVSIISMLEPMLNPVWVALLYGEVPGKGALIGAVLIIGAVTAYSVIDAKVNDTDD